MKKQRRLREALTPVGSWHSGVRSVVGDGAVVEGTVERCLVWDGAYVGPDEHLVECARAGSRTEPLTVAAPVSRD